MDECNSHAAACEEPDLSSPASSNQAALAQNWCRIREAVEKVIRDLMIRSDLGHCVKLLAEIPEPEAKAKAKASRLEVRAKVKAKFRAVAKAKRAGKAEAAAGAKMKAKVKTKAKAKGKGQTTILSKLSFAKSAAKKGKTKKNEEPVGRRSEEQVGLYRVTFKDGLPVSATMERHSEVIAKLDKGHVIEVVKVGATIDQRMRARIAEPAGWVSLRHTGTGYAFAEPLDVPKAPVIVDVDEVVLTSSAKRKAPAMTAYAKRVKAAAKGKAAAKSTAADKKRRSLPAAADLAEVREIVDGVAAGWTVRGRVSTQNSILLSFRAPGSGRFDDKKKAMPLAGEAVWAQLDAEASGISERLRIQRPHSGTPSHGAPRSGALTEEICCVSEGEDVGIADQKAHDLAEGSASGARCSTSSSSARPEVKEERKLPILYGPAAGWVVRAAPSKQSYLWYFRSPQGTKWYRLRELFSAGVDQTIIGEIEAKQSELAQQLGVTIVRKAA